MNSPSAAHISTGHIMGFAPHENFPVAMRLLGQPLRDQLMSLYGYARLIDNLGDDALDADGNVRSADDRLSALDAAERELDLALTGGEAGEIFARLAETVRACEVACGDSGAEARGDSSTEASANSKADFRKELVKLIDVNRLDQSKFRYETWDELMEYCELSANPVGRVVLKIFEADAVRRGKSAWSAQQRVENIVLSDKICSALQVVEHLQDVGEDFRAGRIYLPKENFASFGTSEEDIALSVQCLITSAALRNYVLSLANQARQMLNEGQPLIHNLKGKHRLAITGFIAGGHAAIDAIQKSKGEVLTNKCSPSKPRQLTQTLKLLAFK